MPKRAVMISFQLWKDWITQEFKSGGLECTRGIPKNAVLVQTFLNEYSAVITPALIAVFESPDFEPLRSGEYTIACPDGSRIPMFDVEFTSRYLEETYSVLSWRDGDHERKISIKSIEHPVVLFDWQPDNAEGASSLIEDESCKFDIPWLC